MNLLDRAIGYVSPAAGLRRQQARRLLGARRNYDAAQPSRATAGWRRPFTSSRSETYLALPWLRAGSHDLVRNDPHVAKIIGSLTVDIVGTGIMPKANTGNKRLNRKVDALAERFFLEMSADGATSNLAGYQALAVRAFLEGGEVMSRRYVRSTSEDFAVPLQFALLESEFCDNLKMDDLGNGAAIIEGVEFSGGRRIAYHLFKAHPGDAYMGSLAASSERIRVPAADIRVMWEPQRPGQVRGVPWVTPILLRAKQLADYEDAERRRKQMESSVPVVVKSGVQTADASDPSITSLYPTLVDGDGRLIEKAEAGLIAYLRDGTDIETIEPAEAASYVPYKRSELQSIAAGARSMYELGSGDLSQTNYSSYQAGHIPYRTMVDAIRATIVIPHLRWIWREMIAMAIAAGTLPEGTSDRADWFPPPWLPLDPEKQANADLIDIRSGKKTLREVVIARGKDFDDHLDELAASNKALDRRKIVLDSDPRRTDRRGVEQASAQAVKGDPPAPSAIDPDAA